MKEKKDSNVVLAAKGLTKSFTNGAVVTTVVSGVTLNIYRGEFVAITGPSGSGKSTLMGMLAGLERPTQGSVKLNDKDIASATEDELATIRNTELGFVFQSFHLIPSLTARENILFPLELAKRSDAATRTDSLLKRIGMTHRSDNYPNQLSGGEKQRIAICRALAHEPSIVFADEPTGNLDSTNGKLVVDLLLALQRERNVTLVVVTHEESLAARADRHIALLDGKIANESRTGRRKKQ